MRITKLLIISIALCTGLTIANAAEDLGTFSEGRLAISPFLIETNIKPGESSIHSITVFNITDSPLPIAISVNDFVPTGRQGSVRFLETGELSNPSFSLASWITITEQPAFTLPPRGETKITFTIKAPLEAEPGSHYGGILFSATNNNENLPGTKVVRKVGALILAATGQTNASGNIEQFNTNKGLYLKPEITFNSVFSNTGNVHLAPKGQIAVKNIFGNTVEEAHLNPNAQYVLPGSTRDFTESIQKSWMLGRYTAELTYYFGNPRLEAREKITFWVMPIQKIGIIIAIVISLVFFIRLYNWVIVKGLKK